MADPGKGSKRRPGDEEAYAENFEKIFGKKKIQPGRRYYRWEDHKFVEIPAPKPLPSEMIFEGTFKSPVDGSIISNKYDLLDHNEKHGVQQAVPGLHDDVMSVQKDNLDKAFGKQAKAERIEDIKRAIEQGERNA